MASRLINKAIQSPLATTILWRRRRSKKIKLKKKSVTKTVEPSNNSTCVYVQQWSQIKRREACQWIPLTSSESRLMLKPACWLQSVRWVDVNNFKIWYSADVFLFIRWVPLRLFEFLTPFYGLQPQTGQSTLTSVTNVAFSSQAYFPILTLTLDFNKPSLIMDIILSM